MLSRSCIDANGAFCLLYIHTSLIDILIGAVIITRLSCRYHDPPVQLYSYLMLVTEGFDVLCNVICLAIE